MGYSDILTSDIGSNAFADDENGFNMASDCSRGAITRQS